MRSDGEAVDLLDLIAAGRSADDDLARMTALLRLLQQERLSLPRLVTLAHLYRHGAATVSVLATALGLAAPTVSQALDQLVQAGLVTRAEDRADRRSKQIALTATGRTLVERLRAEQRDRHAARLAGLPEPLRIRLLSVLEECRAALAADATERTSAQMEH